jgi:RNA polymerase sigma factor (sigma-70 family)
VPAGVDADDLVQEVFLRVVRHAGSLRSTDRPEAWLFQIARNALRDSLRARMRRDGRTDPLEIDLPADPDAEAERAAEAELAPCLASMIDRLPEPYRTAVVLTTRPPAFDARPLLRHRARRAGRRLRLPPALRGRLRRPSRGLGGLRARRLRRRGVVGCVRSRGPASSALSGRDGRGPR